MSKYCRICRNTDCGNHGRDITFHGDGWVCNYIPVPTNADRIRAMSDEELARKYAVTGCPRPYDDAVCNSFGDEYTCCYNCWLDWLKQPVKDGDIK